MTVLRTGRLTLRPPRPPDVEAVHAMVSDWEVVRWTASWPWPPDRSFTEARLAADPPAEGLAATILRKGEVVGLASVTGGVTGSVTASVTGGVLGYMLAPSAWGQGIATEACAALIGFAFETTAWPAVEAAVFEGNAASLRVLAKLGFVVSGRSVSPSRALGMTLPGVELRLPRRT